MSLEIDKLECLPQIGLLNLMPAPALPKTEYQWRDALGDSVEVVPVRFDDDPRKGECRSSNLLDGYKTFSQLADQLDGLIVTGANLEVRPDGSPLPFSEIKYIDQLAEIIDWAETDSRLTIYSCLASHIVLKHLYEIDRDIQNQKIAGVYCHDVVQDSPLLDGTGPVIRAPHSRWGNVSAKLLDDTDLTVLAEGFEPGWLVAEKRSIDKLTIFFQGHPEYERDDLAIEYRRDAGSEPKIPENYFPNNHPKDVPNYSWYADRRLIFDSILATANL